MSRINWSGVGVDHTFIKAYIYFVCMEHTFIVVLLKCFVALYILYSKRPIPPLVLRACEHTHTHTYTHAQEDIE